MLRTIFAASALAMCLNSIAIPTDFRAQTPANSFNATPPKTPGILGKRRSLETLAILSKIPVPGGPDWLAMGYGSVWVSNAPDNSISRINPQSATVIAKITVGQDPCLGIGIGFESVWIPNCKDKSLSQIDPKTNQVVRTTPIEIAGEGEGTIGVGEGSIWLLSNRRGTDSGTLSRISPRTGKVITDIAVPAKSYVALVGFGSVWVTSTGGNAVLRIDPGARRVLAKINVHRTPRFTAIGAGSVWVLNQSDGTVSRIDPATNRVAATIAVGVPGAGGDIAVGGGSVWVSSNGLPVSRINPLTNRVVRQFAGGEGADAIRYGFGFVWVSDHKHGEVWKIRP